jgi:hypothetical protein
MLEIFLLWICYSRYVPGHIRHQNVLLWYSLDFFFLHVNKNSSHEPAIKSEFSLLCSICRKNRRYEITVALHLAYVHILYWEQLRSPCICRKKRWFGATGTLHVVVCALRTADKKQWSLCIWMYTGFTENSRHVTTVNSAFSCLCTYL